jgi:hypothetical protein
MPTGKNDWVYIFGFLEAYHAMGEKWRVVECDIVEIVIEHVVSKQGERVSCISLELDEGS